MNDQTLNSLKLYNVAKAHLGKSLVPSDVPIEYGCAISVNILDLIAFPNEGQIGGGASSFNLLQAVIKNPRFQEVFEPLPGDLIIDATGTSTLTNPPFVGHCGVVGYHGIMSNNSFNGLWEEKYTVDTWNQRYQIEGGYKNRYFRHI